MRIGYACLALGVHESSYRTLRMANYTEDKLKEIIEHNLISLNNMIDYNIENNLLLFRITSDLIPFGSSEINELKWWEVYKNEFYRLGKKIKKAKIRVSLHPGQYTVLNSLKKEVVIKSIKELVYHEKILDSLGLDYSAKLVLHIGGVYNDKENSIKRFIDNFKFLPEAVKKRLVIENDDKNYNVEDALGISKVLNIPVVFDNLHHHLNAPVTRRTDKEWIDLCGKTWQEADGVQKIHYSEQDVTKQAGSHSYTINHNTFLDYYNKISRNDLDIMLEVKDKNISAIKIRNCTSNNLEKDNLVKEWNRYKYSVLERSKAIYNELNDILRNETNLSPIKFYDFIDSSLKLDTNLENQIDSIIKVFAHFKDYEIEKRGFLKKMKKLEEGSLSVMSMKNYLYNLASKYNISNLLDSYYFSL